MCYVAQRRLLIDGETRWPGEAVPEVQDWDWQIRLHYEREGYLTRVDSDTLDAAQRTLDLRRDAAKATDHPSPSLRKRAKSGAATGGAHS